MTNNGNESVVLDELKMDGVNIDGKMIVKFNDDNDGIENLRYGDVMTVRIRNITFNEIIKNDEFLSYYFIEDYRYTAYTSLNSVSITIGEMNFIENIHFYVRNTLVSEIGDYGNVAYGVITGNKNFINTNIRDEYSISGLAHILAVSGLHIGFLVSLLTIVLKMFKVKRFPTLIITALVLLLYNVFIGGAVSAIRASIMAIIVLTARCFGTRSDSLNNLCLAVTVILTCMPQSIFDVGFLMSVGAVFGLITIYPSIYKVVCAKIQSKFVKALLSVLCISFSAQIGIIPASVVSFNVIAPYSILSNIVIVPILSIVYTYMLLATIISTILPFISFILYPIKLFFAFVGLVNGLVLSIPYSQIIVYGSFVTYGIYLMIFVSSRFVMLPKKFISILLAIIFSLSLLIVENIPKVKDNTLVYSGSRWDVTSIVCTEGETWIIGDLYSNVNAENIKEMRIRKIDKIFINRLSSYNKDVLVELCKTYAVESVYVNLTDVDNSLIFELIDNGVNILDVQDQKIVTPVFNNGKFLAYALSINSKSVLFVKSNANLDELGQNYVSSFDYVRCSNPCEYDLCVSLDNYYDDLNGYERKRVVSIG